MVDAGQLRGGFAQGEGEQEFAGDLGIRGEPGALAVGARLPGDPLGVGAGGGEGALPGGVRVDGDRVGGGALLRLLRALAPS